MNRKRAKKLLPIIEHFANGGEVQILRLSGIWTDLCDPVWGDDSSEYRIKPDDPLECWVNYYPKSKPEMILHTSEERARGYAMKRKPSRIAVHMREVTE